MNELVSNVFNRNKPILGATIKIADRGEILYGHRMTWNEGTYTVSGIPSLKEAHEAIWRGLDAAGYTRPKWWQFWRWGEQKPPPRQEETI